MYHRQVTVSDIMEGVRTQIKHLLALPDGTEVFTCPSGSDAEYIPLLVAKALGKGRKVRGCRNSQRSPSQRCEDMAAAAGGGEGG